MLRALLVGLVTVFLAGGVASEIADAKPVAGAHARKAPRKKATHKAKSKKKAKRTKKTKQVKRAAKIDKRPMP